MGAMSNSELAMSSAPLTSILTNALGSSIGKALTAAVVICILGTTIGWLMSTARVAYAAGEDGVFLNSLVRYIQSMIHQQMP